MSKLIVTYPNKAKSEVHKEWWEDYEYRADYHPDMVTRYTFCIPYANGQKLFVTEDRALAQILQSSLDHMHATKIKTK